MGGFESHVPRDDHCRPAIFRWALQRDVIDDVHSRKGQSLTRDVLLDRVEMEALAGADTYGRQCRKNTTRTRIAQTVRFHVTGTASNSTNRSEEHTSELQSPCNLVCR